MRGDGCTDGPSISDRRGSDLADPVRDHVLCRVAARSLPEDSEGNL